MLHFLLVSAIGWIVDAFKKFIDSPWGDDEFLKSWPGVGRFPLKFVLALCFWSTYLPFWVAVHVVWLAAFVFLAAKPNHDYFEELDEPAFFPIESWPLKLWDRNISLWEMFSGIGLCMWVVLEKIGGATMKNVALCTIGLLGVVGIIVFFFTVARTINNLTKLSS